MVAALGIACIDAKSSDELAAAVLFSLLGLQNLPESYAETILAYVSARPAAFIAAAEMHWSDAGHQDRAQWLHWLLVQRRQHERVGPAIDTAIRRWLSFWCLDPDRITRRDLSSQELEKERVREAQRRAEVEQRLASLTPKERTFLDRHCVKLHSPELTSIDALAVDLLAGQALAPFASAIVAWQLCDSLSAPIYKSTAAKQEFSWLLRLNPIDFETTAMALRVALEEVESEHPSVTGLWTVIGTLRGTGSPEDADRAEALCQLLPPRPGLPGGRRPELFCNPIDPSAHFSYK